MPIDWNKWGVLIGIPLSISVLVGGGVSLMALGGKIDHNGTVNDDTAKAVQDLATSTHKEITDLSRYVHTHDANSTRGYLWLIQYTGWLERFAARGDTYITSDPPPRDPPPYDTKDDGADARSQQVPVAAGPEMPTIDK